MKIVLNKEYGGFGLSAEQAEAYGFKPNEITEHFGGHKWVDRQPDGKAFDRTDPKLIKVVEQNLAKAFGAKLVVVEIPDNAFYEITEFDGMETIIWSEAPIHFL